MELFLHEHNMSTCIVTTVPFSCPLTENHMKPGPENHKSIHLVESSWLVVRHHLNRSPAVDLRSASTCRSLPLPPRWRERRSGCVAQTHHHLRSFHMLNLVTQHNCYTHTLIIGKHWDQPRSTNSHHNLKQKKKHNKIKPQPLKGSWVCQNGVKIWRVTSWVCPKWSEIWRVSNWVWPRNAEIFLGCFCGH